MENNEVMETVVENVADATDGMNFGVLVGAAALGFMAASLCKTGLKMGAKAIGRSWKKRREKYTVVDVDPDNGDIADEFNNEGR